ncbi:Toll-Interleukin-Resistance domain family protein [Prunus dulcis]|uniref:Toll-Interleukin-Resistance domain family protein n=1 Tax=Prunus dulcis TaxID=3755 RepID=A0A4Y1RDL1_PRUDU|nr:Toll-Interleukin-Resistance domain family protein [Prunus dulcis]
MDDLLLSLPTLYIVGNDADYSPDFSNATIEFMIKGLNSLNIKKNLSRLPLLSKGSHDDNSNHYKQQYQTTGSVDSDPSVSPLPCISTQADTDYDGLDSAGSDDNLSDSLLPSSIPRISTDYDELGNPAVDEHNDFGQPHHRTRVTALELTFMLVGFNLEILSAGFDQVSSTSKPRYALISLLLAVAAVFTCIWELIYNGIKERDASPNSTSSKE